MSHASIEIIGSGVAGLCCAVLFAERGCNVTVRSQSVGADDTCCSWWAGGMLAPWCEMESAEPLIVSLGVESIKFWQERTNAVEQCGSLVVANRRDLPELEQFAGRTSNYQKISTEKIQLLEPDLLKRFDAGLYFEEECHLNPRDALRQLELKLRSMPNVEIKTCDQRGIAAEDTRLSSSSQVDSNVDWCIDCRGLDARDVLTDLRGVRGEMLILHTEQVTLNRPVRLLHPRHPLYIVPRAGNRFMVGATMIESDFRGSPSVRSTMELLSAAYALHPGFGEASIVEMGADARPAFIDNLPRLRRRGKTLFVNGLYRHGFLCAPAMARRTIEFALDNVIDEEVVDENSA